MIGRLHIHVPAAFAALAVLCACGKDPLPCRTPGGRVTVHVSLVQDGLQESFLGTSLPTKAGSVTLGTCNMDEVGLNTSSPAVGEVLLQAVTPDAWTYSHWRAQGWNGGIPGTCTAVSWNIFPHSGTAGTFTRTVSVPYGTFVLQAAVNCFESLVAGSTQGAYMWLAPYGNVGRGAQNPQLAMYGDSYITAGSPSTSVSITLKRLYCRLYVKSIATTLTGHDIRIAKYFITNSPEVVTPARAYWGEYGVENYNSPRTLCHNLTTEGDPSSYRSTWGVNVYFAPYVQAADYYENTSSSPCTLHPLYCGPTDGDKSFLMLSLLIDGTEYFYKVALPAMLAGHSYYIDNITVSHIGSTDPLKPTLVRLDVDTSADTGWQQGGIYGEGF